LATVSIKEVVKLRRDIPEDTGGSGIAVNEHNGKYVNQKKTNKGETNDQ